MKRVEHALAVAILVALITSCGTWQSTGREVAGGMFDTVRLAKTVGVEVQHKRCKELALECSADASKCGAFKGCQETRHKIENYAIDANKAIAVLLLAIEVGSEAGFKAKLEAAKAKLKVLEALLAKEGVLK